MKAAELCDREAVPVAELEQRAAAVRQLVDERDQPPLLLVVREPAGRRHAGLGEQRKLGALGASRAPPCAKRAI